MTTDNQHPTSTNTRRRRTLRRLARAALYAVVRGSAAAAGSVLITEIIVWISQR